MKKDIEECIDVYPYIHSGSPRPSFFPDLMRFYAVPLAYQNILINKAESINTPLMYPTINEVQLLTTGAMMNFYGPDTGNLVSGLNGVAGNGVSKNVLSIILVHSLETPPTHISNPLLILMTGDSTTPPLETFSRNSVITKYRMIKAPHHGSSISANDGGASIYQRLWSQVYMISGADRGSTIQPGANFLTWIIHGRPAAAAHLPIYIFVTNVDSAITNLAATNLT